MKTQKETIDRPLGQKSAKPDHESELATALREYADAIQAGNPPDIPTFLNQHRAVADELADCIRTLDFMQHVGLDLDLEKAARGDEHISGQIGEDTETNRMLGDYRIVREAGRGGMGVVYEAQQVSLDRQVALKILPFAALANDQQLQRFKNEARAAATLQHPHIVPVYAVGCERGIHYYTMQYIEGPTLADVLTGLRSKQPADPHAQESDITRLLPRKADTPADGPDGRVEPHKAEFESEAGADTRREIQAEFSTRRSTSKASHYRTVARWGVEAAEALAYSHENGVLHRDIKPANLLIDRAGKIWITDFGLARLEKDASMTMTGDLIGTLRYMAPEQALAKRIPIDHRADVYSLGVTLYELLTLRPAFDGRDREQLLRQIAFAEPPPPRKIEPSIPTELETIVLKAMGKSPEDRYASAQEFADDLARFLHNEPILARPPSPAERLIKWGRRNQFVVVAATIMLMAITIASVSSAALIWRANRRTAAALANSERNLREVENQKNVAAEQRDLAKRRSREYEAVVHFLVNDLLGSGDPSQRGLDLRVADILQNAESKMATSLQGEPLIEASVRQAIGLVYKGLGDFEPAQRHLEVAYQLRARHLGERHKATMYSRSEVATVYCDRGDYQNAETMLKSVLDDSLSILGPEDPFTLQAQNRLGILLQRQGELRQAEALYRELLEKRRQLQGYMDEGALMAAHNLSYVLDDLGKYEEAERLNLEVLETSRCLLGEDHSIVSLALMARAGWHRFHQEYGEAEKIDEELVKISERAQGPHHPGTLGLKFNLAMNKQDLTQQEQILREITPTARRVLGSEHPQTLLCLYGLAGSLYWQGEYAEARDLYTQVLDARRDALGESHPDTISTLEALAWVASQQHRAQEAEDLFRRALDLWRTTVGERHPSTMKTMRGLAEALGRQKKYAESAAMWQLMAEASETLHGPEHPKTLNAKTNVAWNWTCMKRPQDARQLAEDVLEDQLRVLGPEHLDTLVTQDTLAEALEQLGQLDEARTLREEILRMASSLDLKDEERKYLGAFKSSLAMNLVMEEKGTDHQRAVRLAKEATELEVRDIDYAADFWRVLGVTQACLGRSKRALDSLTRAKDLGFDGEFVPATILERLRSTNTTDDDDNARLLDFIDSHSMSNEDKSALTKTNDRFAG